MSNNYNMLPDQRVSLAEKQKPEWYKPNIDYYISLALSLHDKTAVSEQIDAANGVINSESYSKLLQSLVPTGNEQYLNLPNELREVDWITNIIETHMGEYIELPYKFQVKSINYNSILSSNLDVREELLDRAQEAYVQIVMEQQQAQQQAQQQQQAQAKEQGQEQGQQVQQQPQPELPDFKSFIEQKTQEILDKEAKDATDILKLINSNIDFSTMRVQMYYDWLTTDQFYSHRYIKDGNLNKEVISPTSGYPIMDENDQFVEDGHAFLIHDRISYEKFQEIYQDLLDDKDVDLVNKMIKKNRAGKYTNNITRLISNRFDESWYDGDKYISLQKSNDSRFLDDNRTVERNILYWITETKIKIRSYIDRDVGDIKEEIVDNKYKFNVDAGDISIDTKYMPEVYIAYRFGDEATGVYIKPEPNIFQRYDELGFIKLPVGGKIGILRNKYLNPIPQRLLPYLAFDRLLLVVQQRTLAKYKGSILVMPQNLLNDDTAGTAQEKYLYMKGDNMLVYDQTEVDALSIQQGIRTISDPELIQWLTTLIELRRVNKEEAMVEASMNSDRSGQIDTRAVKGNVEQNIYRAKLGSALSIYMFNKALEKDHMADLEASKIAYIDGFDGIYFDDEDESISNITIDGEKHLNNRYRVIISNSRLDHEKLQKIKEMIGFSASQSADYDVAVESITNDSIIKLKDKVLELVDKKRQYEEQSQSRQEQMIQLQLQDKDKDRQLDVQLEQMKQNGALEREYIKADINLLGIDANNNNVDDSKEVIAASKERQKDIELSLKERIQTHKEKDDSEKNKLKEKDIEAKVKIAKENKNKYDN